MNAPAADAANVRALAAQALERIVEGESLRAAFATFSTKLHDARDRALLSSLLHEGARWWLRYDAAAGVLLERPLRDARGACARSCSVWSSSRCCACPNTPRSRPRSRQCARWNAQVRRPGQCAAAALAARTRDVDARSSMPTKSRAAHIRAGCSTRSARTGRTTPTQFSPRTTRRRRCGCASIAVAQCARNCCNQFAAAGIAADAPAQMPDALVLARSVDVTRLPGYAQGAFSVQDGAAQFAADLLDLRDGQRVLDACAAPGGKSAQILERADVDLVALDSDASRLPRLRENLARLRPGRRCARGRCGAAVGTGGTACRSTRILLDAPCSATGIMRRQPDIKLHRRAGDMPRLPHPRRGCSMRCGLCSRRAGA